MQVVVLAVQVQVAGVVPQVREVLPVLLVPAMFLCLVALGQLIRAVLAVTATTATAAAAAAAVAVVSVAVVVAVVTLLPAAVVADQVWLLGVALLRPLVRARLPATIPMAITQAPLVLGRRLVLATPAAP